MTPTREQVIEWAKAVGIDVPTIVFDSERISIEFRGLLLFAMAAIAADREEGMKRVRNTIIQAEERGRAQGLREAREVCEARAIEMAGFTEEEHASQELAAAIKQLEGE